MENTLGKRIQASRKRLGLTQEQLAEKMGVSGQAVSKWESDMSCPDITLIPQLADLFGLTSDELLRGQQNTPDGILLAADTGKVVDDMSLRIVVNADEANVRVSMPIRVIKALISSGMDMGDMLSMQGVTDKKVKNSIDFDAIMRMVESGLCGHLLNVEVDTEDSTSVVVDIFVE